jgi:hypothetical protein
MKQQTPRLHQVEFELFEVATARPRWPEIPIGVRETVTELVARMLARSPDPNQDVVREEREAEHE